MHSNGDPEASRETRARAISLYTFLKEFAELRAETIRTVDRYDQVLWLDEIPREPECYSAARQKGGDELNETWVEVRKPRVPAAPVPPPALRPWIADHDWQTSESELPALRDKIVLLSDAEETPQELQLSQTPEIKGLWERYVENDWWPWRESDRRGREVQRVYTDLFQMYQRQQRLGEQYEVVLGLGLLNWQLSPGLNVLRHLIVASASVSFNAKDGVVTVGPGTNGAKPVLEQDMLDPAKRPSADDLRAIEGQITDIGDAIWDIAVVEPALKAWVHATSATGSYMRESGRQSASDATPRVSLAPAVILRKRTDRSFIRAFREILAQLQNGADIPEGVARFVSVSRTPTGEQRFPDEAGTDASTSTATEVYFPLPANDDQVRIVERLRGHRGVLVQGPPGTGKSHTIVNLVCHLLASGQRVLVTSHTSRALSVLKRYVQTSVPEIGPLAVLLLGEGTDALQAMEDSVQGITQRHNQWDPANAPRAIAAIEAALSGARRDEALASAESRTIRERETYKHRRLFGTYDGTLSEIGVLLRHQTDELGWLPDDIQEENEPPLSHEEFRELIDLWGDRELGQSPSILVANFVSPTRQTPVDSSNSQ